MIKPITVSNKLGNLNKKIIISPHLPEIKCSECNEKTIRNIPVVIPPTWNKTGDYGIERVWRHAINDLSEARNIFIIGYSLPKTDLFFQYLLALGTLNIEILDRFWVYDGDIKIEEKYSSFLDHDLLKKFDFPRHSPSLGMTFDQALARLSQPEMRQKIFGS